MFHFWFNTGFIHDNYLLFHKDVLDRACKDKACKEFESEFKGEQRDGRRSPRTRLCTIHEERSFR